MSYLIVILFINWGMLLLVSLLLIKQVIKQQKIISQVSKTITEIQCIRQAQKQSPTIANITEKSEK